MKILIYNIAYGTGSPGAEYRRLLTGHRFLSAPERPFRKIVKMIGALQPDVVGLLEADLGSYRTGRLNHAAALAAELELYPHCRLKYGPGSTLSKLPYLKHQGNALLTREVNGDNAVDFFPRGTKKLILESTVGGVRILLVHLALTRAVRKIQLEYLASLIVPGMPTVVAGDFNTFGGVRELWDFLGRTHLRSANGANLATYPAWSPQKELDYVLLSPELALTGFEVPKVHFSDHLPLLAEIERR